MEKMKKPRYRSNCFGNIIGNKEKIKNFVSQVVEFYPDDMSIFFEFNFKEDRYYKQAKTLREIKHKKKRGESR